MCTTEAGPPTLIVQRKFVWKFWKFGGGGVKFWGLIFYQPFCGDGIDNFLEPNIYMKEEVVKKPLKHMLWQAYNVRASYTAVKEKDYNP